MALTSKITSELKEKIRYDREPEQIQAFLRDYLDVPNLTLVLIMQCVHLGNGYPLWRFDFVRG